MIITNAVLLHVPKIVLFYCSTFGPSSFIQPAHVFRHIKVTGFCLQGLIIGGIYIHESLRAFKPVLKARGCESRRVIYHLVLVSFLVVSLDIALLVAEYKAHYLEISFNAVVYSIKLKVDFIVLTRLRSLTRTHPCVCDSESNQPRRSSDIKIFDMASARSPAADIEAPPFSPGHQLRSFQSSTHDFHQALREVASNENMVSPRGTWITPPVS